MAGRVREIVDGVLGEPGSTFMCHKTTGVLGNKAAERHCAGALVFAERHNHATQMTRIAERLGMYDRAALLATPEAADVFRTKRAMLGTALDRRGAAARNAAKGACPAGHPYDGANLYVRPSGARQCRTCRRQSSEAHKRQERQGIRVR